MAVPARTIEQRRDASIRAVAARRRRAELSAALKAGELSMGDLLELAAEDEAAGAMRVRSALESLPRMGPGRAAAAMTRLRISDSRRLRGLGPTQRAALLELTAATAPTTLTPTASPTRARAAATTPAGSIASARPDSPAGR